MRALLRLLCWLVLLDAGSICAQGIDYAVLQYPISATVAPGQSATPAFGNIYIALVTGMGNQPPGVSAQLGIGAHGTDPSTDSTWRWIQAVWNMSSANNDEYQAYFKTHASGSYDYAYRFAYNAGAWVYADLDGTINGYSTAQAGQLTVSGDTIFTDDIEGE